MSLRKTREIRLANILLEHRYLTEQPLPPPPPPSPGTPSPAPGTPSPAPPAPPAAPPAPPAQTTTTLPTTTTTTKKITEEDLEKIPDCSSGKFGVTDETFNKVEVGGYVVRVQKTPAKGSSALKCKTKK